jgi:hypothetical protein
MRLAVALTVLAVAAAGVQAGPLTLSTIATFADPSQDSADPLFFYDAPTNTVSATWDEPGMTLQTIAGDFVDATFVMTADPGVDFGDVGAGTVVFSDADDNVIFTIEFDSGQLSPTAFGATEFLGLNDIQFSGTILPNPTENESFGFALVNQVPNGDNGSWTATASFTSSATIVPEPASLMLLGLGGFALLRRR